MKQAVRAAPNAARIRSQKNKMMKKNLLIKSRKGEKPT